MGWLGRSPKGGRLELGSEEDGREAAKLKQWGVHEAGLSSFGNTECEHVCMYVCTCVCMCV